MGYAVTNWERPKSGPFGENLRIDARSVLFVQRESNDLLLSQRFPCSSILRELGV